MSLPSLSSKDFKLKQNPNNKVSLYINNPRFKGFTLVLYKTKNCPLCKKFEPDFYNLQRKFAKNGINFAIVDTDSYPDIPYLSRRTEKPITGVPTLHLFKDGNQCAYYNGKKNEQSVSSFLNKAISKLSKHAPQLYTSQQPRGQYPPPHPGAIPNFHQQGDNQVYQPKLDNIPRGIEQRYQNTDFNDEEFQVPEGVTPHNKPWENKYKDVEF